MSMVLEELVAKLSISIDKQKLKNALTGLQKTKKEFLGIKTAVLAAEAGIFAFERKMITQTFQMGKTSKILGISTKQFQGLQLAASKSGESFDSVVGSVTALNTKLAGIKIGNFPSDLGKALAKLQAFSGKKVTFYDKGHLQTGAQLFNKIGQALLSVRNHQEQIALSSEVFGKNLIPFFEQLKSSQKEVGDFGLSVTTAQTKEATIAFQKMAVVGQELRETFQLLGAELSPGFIKALDAISHALLEVGGLLKGFESFRRKASEENKKLGFSGHSPFDLSAAGNQLQKIVAQKVVPHSSVFGLSTDQAYLKKLVGERGVARPTSVPRAETAPQASSSVVNNNHTNQSTTNNISHIHKSPLPSTNLLWGIK
jgi:hypothetical protein